MKIRPYQASDQRAVMDLWTQCGLVRPQNHPLADIHRKLADSPEWFLVGTLETDVVATLMAGYDGHRGWLNYLAVAPEWQKRGYGCQIVQHAEELLRACGCPKINLQVRTTNREALEFYRRLGFSCDEVVSMGKRLVPDEPLLS